MTFISNWIPFQEPNGGPNFFPFATDASYIINVDNDGDAILDVTFRWTFKNIDKRGNNTFLYNAGVVASIDDKNLLFRQVYTLEKWTAGDRWKSLVKDAPVATSLAADPTSIAAQRGHARPAAATGARAAGYAYHLGMIELALGQRDEARADLTRALRTNPSFSQTDASAARKALADLGAAP